jgi:hypothetical protein
MPERLERRLTTILAADFAEHGRLMRADEDGDPNQEFFADGVGEDMITRCPNLFVIAPRGTRPHPRNLTAPPRSPRRLAQSLRPWRTSSPRRAGPPDDPLYFTDTDVIKLGDLCLCHPILRQCADARELRCGYHAGIPPDCAPTSGRFRLSWRYYLCCFRWHRRQGSKNSRLPSRWRLGGRNRVFGRRGRADRLGLRLRLKQVFRIFSRSVDLCAINLSVYQPFARQSLLQ